MGEAVQQHIPCKYCGSSDAGSIYEDDNGTQWFKCFSCGVNRKHRGGTATRPEKREAVSLNYAERYGKADSKGMRGISEATIKKYGIRADEENVYFPYFKDDEVVGFKIRKQKDKTFFADGNTSKGGLFGQELFASAGKYVTLTEGEFDAAAAHEMMGSKWPVVSIRSGAAAAAVRRGGPAGSGPAPRRLRRGDPLADAGDARLTP